ncbi:hypothetical protein PR003_g4514 [Phytophthora rubi]|nr:hypothetical protein PR003_g4514 [Phytophthora rubi]
MTGPIRWAWLIYAVFCGSSSVSRNSVQIWGSLSSEDLVMIEEVLRTNYPQPVLQQSQDHPSKYGFVDIQEGAQLSGKNGIRLEITRALRCRALYNPTTMGDSVEVVVPGYGICTAKIEDGGNNFVSDAVCPSLPSSQLKSICSLMLHLSTLESVATLMQLLRLIGGSLRSLYLGSQRDQAADLSSQSHMQQAYLSLESQRQHIDLCMLATICPDQEKLDLKFYGIRVSVPNEALRQWAIKEMTLYGVGDFSALMTCLTDTTLRMRKTLAVLGVFSYIRPLCPDDIERLIALEGEFLPVTKEKFPKLSKAAMLSAVRSGWNNNSSTGAMRALSRLDASVLSLIFTFASIPERRYIRLK